MKVNVTGKPICDEEIQAYCKRGMARFGSLLDGVDIDVISDEEVTITYHIAEQPFERVRRITGYLVGTMDKWNNAKRAEEHDRVKHGGIG